jgi:hypothetical protein
MEIAKLIDVLSTPDRFDAPFADFLRRNVVVRNYKKGALLVKVGEVVAQT